MYDLYLYEYEYEYEKLIYKFIGNLNCIDST